MSIENENGNFAKPMLAEVAVELTEPNHLDYKVKNKYDEWVWKSPYAMNRYADDWEAWRNRSNKLDINTNVKPKHNS